MAIEAGRVLSERYRLIRPVGQGSQASVWVAEHLALTTHVAVKLITQELAKKDSARERFRREATAAAQLRSAHVVQILDHGIDGDQPFIVMELLDGEDLFERLAHRGRLSLRETSKIVTQVARALSRAHAAGIVHRDLKPENVFLCPNDDDEVVKVLDFGVAKVKDAAKVTMQKTGVGTLIGTPHYMSPEQVKGIGETHFHTDLWALGVIDGVAPRASTVRPPPGAAPPGVAPPGVAPPGVAPPGAANERPAPAPRAATQQLDVDDWEEIGFEEAETKAPAPVAAAAPVVSRAGQPPRPSLPRAGAGSVRPEVADQGVPLAPLLSGPGEAAPTRGAPPRVVAPPAAEGHEAQEIVDFDETIPAHSANVPALIRAQHAAWEARAVVEAPRVVVEGRPPQESAVLPDNGANAPWDEPAAQSSEAARTSPRGVDSSAARRPVAPMALPPQAGEASAPVSRPSSPEGPTSVRGSPHPTAVPVVTQVDSYPRALALIADEPEFDGTLKRRRMVRTLVAALVIAAVGITVTVVRSQLDLGAGADVQPTSTGVAAPPTPAPTPTITATAVPSAPQSAAVDPGKVTHPTKPLPTARPSGAPTFKNPGKRLPRPNDGTIIIPEPDEETVPPAP